MKLDIIVLLKQVPDTREVTTSLMTEEGMVNRSALPTIVNPQDLQALEQALQLKRKYPETTVRLLTMGPPSAADVLREGLWRGADSAVLLCDRRLSGADTLATSYALSQAICKMGKPDFVFCGYQSLDGDTAHVGPQVAEFLGYEQVSSVERLLKDAPLEKAVQKRNNSEVCVAFQMPAVVSFNSMTLQSPRRNAHAELKFKHASTLAEQAEHSILSSEQFAHRPYLTIEQWTATDIDADEKQIGQQGSPTKVIRTETVTFVPKGGESFSDSDADVVKLMTVLSQLTNV